MITIRSSFFTLFIILFFISGCSKKEREVINFPDDLKPYSLFQTGSYWIYENNVTGKKDCTYVDKAPEFSWYYYGETGPKEEMLDCSFGGDFLSALSGIHDGEGGTYTLSHIFRNMGGSISIISGHIQKGFIRTSTISNYFFRVVGTHDTLNISGRKYFDVVTTQFSRLHYGTLDSILRTYYLSPDYGLLRFTLRTNGIDTTWNLVRSNVRR